MARQTLTVEEPGAAALEYTPTALHVDGHAARLSKDLQLLIENGSTGFTLTIPTPITPGGLALADFTQAIGANENWILNFRTVNLDLYRQADGTIHLDFSDATDGSVAAWR